MPEIRTIIFDIGNVLVDWDPRYLYEKLIPDEEEREWFVRDVVNMDWHKEHDRGRSVADGVALLQKQYPEYGEWIEAYDTRWDETINSTIDGTLELLEQLVDKGLPVFAITNFPKEKFAEFRKQYAFTSLFEGVVVSAEEGLIKPDPRIFHVALNRYKIDPEASLFIDDRLDNVLAAEQLNMVGHQFTEPSRLKLHLQELGLL